MCSDLLSRQRHGLRSIGKMNKVKGMWVRDEDKFIEKYMDENGHFEYYKVLAALKYVTNWDCFLDGGAHYGTWTIPLSEKFKKVIAFEGSKDTYDCLIKNVAGCENVEAINKAVGEKYGSVQIGIGEQQGTLGNCGVQTIIGLGNTPMVPIDSLNIKSLGLIKLDVEGYELQTLKGAEETLKRCKPVVIFEENCRCLEHNVAYGESGKYLESLGAKKVEAIHTDYIYKWE